MKLNFGAVCRICLKSGILKSLFTTARKIDSIKLSCSVMMVTCASVTVAENDGLPQNICTKCISNLKTSYTFRKQCEQSHSILLNLHDEIHNSSQNENPTEIHHSSQNENSMEIHDSSQNDFKGDLVKQEVTDTIFEGSDNIAVLYENIRLKEELDEEFKNEVFDDGYKVSSINESDLNFLQDADDFDYIEPIIEETKIINDIVPGQNAVGKNRKVKMKKAFPTEIKKKIIKNAQQTEQLLGFDVKSMKNVDGKFQCNQCPQTIIHKRSFVRHLESHLGIKSFFCEICQKYYARQWVHMQTHIRPRNKQYQCDKCDKSYGYKSSLTLHMMSHTKKRPHVCDDCGKGFQRLDRLRWHKKTHAGEKDYICQFCSKEFYTQKNLLTHIKYKHTNDRKYQCTRCEKSFVTGECLRIHEKRHLGIKKYQCDYCDKCFVTKSAKDCHHKMHTKEKPHACRVCGLKFGRTDHRNRHETTAHGMHHTKTQV